MSSKRNFGLDLARALAIVMVFFSHGVKSFGVFGVGVDLFFLLSGFLIGRIFLRSQADATLPSGTFSLFGFWKARWFRTLPPYLMALGLFALAEPFFHNNAVHLYYLLFLQTYLGMDGFAVTWSLCVEEHFYLALPLLGYVAIRFLGRRSLLWLLPVLALVPQLLRIVYVTFGRLPNEWYRQTQFHCEGLILGVWLAYLFVDRPDLWKKVRTPFIPLAIIPVLALAYEFRHPIEPTDFRMTAFLLYAIGYAAWLRLLYDLRWSPRNYFALLVKDAVHGIALSSYSIYLVHTLFFNDIQLLLDRWPHSPVKSITILTSSFALSVVFYLLVERPTINLRDRLMAHSKGTKQSASVGA